MSPGTPQAHQAEIFRLKGLFLDRIGDANGANAAFSQSLMLHRHSPDTWVSWGAYCDHMYEASQPRNPMWLEYAVSCYLQVRGEANLTPHSYCRQPANF